jgi:hypothetical protein
MLPVPNGLLLTFGKMSVFDRNCHSWNVEPGAPRQGGGF